MVEKWRAPGERWCTPIQGPAEEAPQSGIPVVPVQRMGIQGVGIIGVWRTPLNAKATSSCGTFSSFKFWLPSSFPA